MTCRPIRRLVEATGLHGNPREVEIFSKDNGGSATADEVLRTVKER